MIAFELILQQFKNHYLRRFDKVQHKVQQNKKGVANIFQVNSKVLKKGNCPTIYHHGRKTPDVIILTHGLSDSPYYVQAIGRRFHTEGLNVIFPLLPGHGLKEPDKAMEDNSLDTKWRDEIDTCITIAQQLGKRISLGGFSAGGALSYNAILRHPQKIKGGLFLFAAAIDIPLADDIAWLSFLGGITKISDGKIIGVGRNPFKYPIFPKFGALELGEIIQENTKLAKKKKIQQPVFAAHSIDDPTAYLKGILNLLEHHCEHGVAFLVAANIAHGELTLNKDIRLDLNQNAGPKQVPRANPEFETMMESALLFFRNHVLKKTVHS